VERSLTKRPPLALTAIKGEKAKRRKGEKEKRRKKKRWVALYRGCEMNLCFSFLLMVIKTNSENRKIERQRTGFDVPRACRLD